MFKKLYLSFLLCSFILYSNFSVSVSRRILNFRTPVEERSLDGLNEINETSFSQSQNNNSSVTTESDILFWEMPTMNSTLEPNSHLPTETQKPEVEESTGAISEFETSNATIEENTDINQEASEITETDKENTENNHRESFFDVPNASDFTADEKIVLYRNNCNLEISVEETQDLKMEIEFQKLKNNTSGKCCITLNGHVNTWLGILISNIHLYQNASKGEVIKVITADYGSDFVLKEYYSKNKYQPLLLTETHKVFIVLYYEVESVPINEQNSHFNLEVFCYQKIEHSFNKVDSHNQSHLSNKYGVKNISPTEPYYFYNYYK